MSTVAVQVPATTRLTRWLPWIGWFFSAAAMSILLMSARWKLTLDPWYVQEWGRLGWMQEALPLIGIIQLACVVLYHYFVRLIVVWLGPAERRGLYFFGEFCTLRG